MPNQDSTPARGAPKPRRPIVPCPDDPHDIHYSTGGRARRIFSAKGKRSAPSGKRRPPKHKRWSGAVETVFLNALAGSGNVVWSAKRADIAPDTAWYHRRNRPEFARRWALALDQAFTMLEFELVASARKALGGAVFPTGLKIKPMSAEAAIRVLSMYKASLARDGRRGGFEPLPGSMEDVREDILRKIRAIINARRTQG